MTTNTPSGMSTSNVAQVVLGRAADLQYPGGLPQRLFDSGPVVEVAARERAAPLQLFNSALEDHLATPRSRHLGRGRRTWSAIAIVLRLMLHDENGVLPLFA